MTALRLLHDQLLVREVLPIVSTGGGIVIAPAYDSDWHYPEGEVLLAGPEARRWVAPGDHIVWMRHHGVREVLLRGEPLLVLRASELVGLWAEADGGFRPLHDRVLLRRAPAAETTPGGIILPDIAKEKALVAEAVAVGPGTLTRRGELLPLSVRAGDQVLLGRWAGTQITLAGQPLVIAREADLLGIF
jgi:chaperonin GroES